MSEDMKLEDIRKQEPPHAYIKIYAVNPPHAYVGIYLDPLTNQYRYDVIEPRLFREERKILKQLKDILLDELDVRLEELENEKDAEKYLKMKIISTVKKYKLKVTEETLGKIMYYIIRDFIGYGKIDVMMRDPLIEDISCDGPELPVFVWHREYESIPTNVIFESAEELDAFVIRLSYRAGKHVSVAQPIIDGALPDGSRVQVTYGREVSLKGSSFTIRKFRKDPLTIIDLIKYNTLSINMAAYFWFAIENRASILIAGGVAAGKTTLLNALSLFIPPEFKIVSIED
ncbi:MAG: type II/IV secretion system ATPase subunit, partial [archaeon GB-1867-035]|nr:type II/IV secretion system ATPase subunit [Candidatus Culexmicrobium profundum]